MTGRRNPTTSPPSRFARIAERLQITDSPAWRLSALAGVVVLVLGVAALFVLDPVTTPLFPRCPFFVATGLHCPGCGTARALHAALHGRFAEALRFNAALPAALTIVVICVAFPRLAYRPAFTWSALGLAIGWCVARNILGI